MRSLFQAIMRNAFVALLIVAPFSTAFCQVPEIRNTLLPDIARVSWFRGPLPQYGLPYYDGPIIVYNPTIAAAVGEELSTFFRAHEYCHIELQHIQKLSFASDPYSQLWMSQALELQADSCSASKLIGRGNQAAVLAAIRWFYGEGPIPKVPSHPPGTARAQNLERILRESGYPMDERTKGGLREGPSKDVELDDWIEIGPEAAGVELLKADYGDMRSGNVRVSLRIENLLSDEPIRVEATVVVIRADRKTRRALGSVDEDTKSTVIDPEGSDILIYRLRWATSDWEPDEDEMPGVSIPGDKFGYGKLRIYKRRRD